MMEKIVRIGGACAFIGDSVLGPRQLSRVEGMHYLVFDYLAEMTLSSFANDKKKTPDGGYAHDFVEVALRDVLSTCLSRGIRLVSNAGGLNPQACAQAVQKLAQELGLHPKVAYIDGDDCLGMVDALRSEQVRDFYDQSLIPCGIDSANAYLGAPAIAQALDLGADIVITGRIVDSAATLGILMHEFGWRDDDWDRLAAGSLAGHILECGAQATGGIFTDWREVPDWESIGYPYLECRPNGEFTVHKPEGSGGLLTTRTVSEQILYEVGDPARYVLPDVVCDFTAVEVRQLAEHCVLVRGAKGLPAPSTYKISATYLHGYRTIVQLSVFGLEAVDKARRTGQALLQRVRSLLAEAGHDDFDKTSVHVLGAEDSYGPHAIHSHGREAIARVAAVHAQAQPLRILAREARAAGVSFAPGTTSGSALNLNSQAAVEPRYRLFSCLLEKSRLPLPQVVMNGKRIQVSIRQSDGETPHSTPSDWRGPCAPAPQTHRQVPLVMLAHGRSGDKGDTSNIAIIARHPEHLPILRRELTPEKVKTYLRHLVLGEVYCYEVPGLHALNFVLLQAQDGGGPSSLRPDPMGKGFAQMLLGMPVHAD
jgi:hypothetical protein